MRHFSRAIIPGLAICFSLLLLSPIHAVTFIVNDLGDQPNANPGNGSPTTAGGLVTLRSAIQELQAMGVEGTVEFSPVFQNGGNMMTWGTELPPITRGLTIKGPGMGNLTVFINSPRFLSFTNTTGESEISDLAFTGATNSVIGVQGSTLFLRSCFFLENHSTTTAGVLRIAGNSIVAMIGCRVGPDNRATHGGAVFMEFAGQSSFLALNSSFVENKAVTADGGALYLSAGNNFYVVNCTFDGNTAADWGGALIINSTLADDTQYLGNCTITDNSAVTGGGIYRVASASDFRMDNTVVAGNSASGGFGPDVSGSGGADSSHNLIGNGISLGGIVHGLNGNQVGTGANPLNPLLGPLQFNGGPVPTRHPAVNSPLINKSDIEPVFALTDTRGVPRNLGGAVDIGAVETIRVNTLEDLSGDFYGAGEFSLRKAMTIALERAPIDFEPALFVGGPKEILLTSALPTITKATIINGPGADKLTLRATSGRIFELNNSLSKSTISGLAMTGATNSGILNNGSWLELERCHLHGNSAPTEGGAIDNDNGASLYLYDCEIGPNNSAPFGGGVDNDIGATNFMRAIGTLFHGNTATTASGGAIFSGSSHTTQLLNCTIAGNSAQTTGGGIHRAAGTGSLLLANCTIAGNTSSSGGRGLHSTAAAERHNLENTVIAGNLPGGELDFFGQLAPAQTSYSMIGVTNGSIGVNDGVNGNKIGTMESPRVAQLGPLGNHGGPTRTMKPQDGSALIDAGTPHQPFMFMGLGITTDARGMSRLFGAAVDIGAVEIHPSDAAIPGDFNGDGKVTVADATLLGNFVTGKIPTLPTAIDVNNDGHIDLLDAQALLQGIADGLY